MPCSLRISARWLATQPRPPQTRKMGVAEGILRRVSGGAVCSWGCVVLVTVVTVVAVMVVEEKDGE